MKKPVKRVDLPAQPRRQSQRKPTPSPREQSRDPETHDLSVILIQVDAIDWSLAIRPVNVDHLQELAGAAHLPAIKVHEYQPGSYRGIDGHHRWQLAKARGDRTITAVVRRFPQGDDGKKAIELECIQSNMEHGLPLSRQERNRAISRIWQRWGRTKTRPDGLTLEDLARLFNLTKPRIHQILAAQTPGTADSANEPSLGLPNPPGSLVTLGESGPQPCQESENASRSPRPGGFSNFARFSAATQRLTTILSDTPLIVTLLQERNADVLLALQKLFSLMNTIAHSSESQGLDRVHRPRRL
jgi:hypothetical protein